MAALDGLVLHRIDDLQTRDDFAGGENADLELVVGDRRDSLGEVFTGAVDRVERLGKARRQAPLHLGYGLGDRGRGERAGSSNRGAADTGGAQKFATLHLKNSQRVLFFSRVLQRE